MKEKEKKFPISGNYCSLTNEALRKRIAFLKREIKSAITGIEDMEDGLLLKFEESEGLDAKLIEWIIAERKCCPFFEISLKMLPFQYGIEMQITGEGDAKELIRSVLLD